MSGQLDLFNGSERESAPVPHGTGDATTQATQGTTSSRSEHLHRCDLCGETKDDVLIGVCDACFHDWIDAL